MNIQLTGKIEDASFHNGTHTTLLMTPAPDQYSQPSTYKLKSDMALGNVGSEVTVDVAMRGFVRKKPYNDKQTGQAKVFIEDNVILSVTKVSAKASPVKAAG